MQAAGVASLRRCRMPGLPARRTDAYASTPGFAAQGFKAPPPPPASLPGVCMLLWQPPGAYLFGGRVFWRVLNFKQLSPRRGIITEDCFMECYEYPYPFACFTASGYGFSRI